MTSSQLVAKLRGGSLRFYIDGIFTTIQLNRRSKRICWELLISQDRKGWIVQHSNLSLRDLVELIVNQKKFSRKLL